MWSGRLDDLKRIRHVGGARHAGQVALDFGIELQAVLEIFLLVRHGLGQVGQLAAFDNAKAGWDCAGRAKLEHRSGVRRVTLDVPIGSVQNLPDSVEIGWPSGARGAR